MINLFNVPISITSKSQALALILGWVKEWHTANPSEHSENSDSRKVRQSENQKSRIKSSGSLAFRYSDSSGSPSIPSFPKIVVTPNPEMIVAAQTDPEFLKALQSADLAIPDGIGIVWALRILNTEYRIPNEKSKSPHSVFRIQNSVFFPPRLSGLDLMESLIGESAKHGWRVMLLGGRPGIAEKAAKILSENSENNYSGKLGKLGKPEGQIIRKPERQNFRLSDSPAFRRSGIQSIPSVLKIRALSGPKDVSRASPRQTDKLIETINRARPDLLFVAFGHGKQEKWLAANRRRLNVGVAMGVGGALDQIADPSLRPPAYINSIGMGWLYRLLREPWRWRRQLALVKFVGMVLGKKFEARNSKLETNSNFQNPNAQNQQF